MGLSLSEKETMPNNDIWLQYGALGALTLLCILAVRALFNRQIVAYQRETERADRLEDQLKSLNETIHSQYLTILAQATSTISEALNLLREIEYEQRRRQD